MKSLKPAKALDYKARLLAEIAPQGFDVTPFSSDIHMIRKATPKNPVARIMTRDSGWVEIDTISGKVVRAWGAEGRAQILAAALADELGVEVEHLARTAGVGADAKALKVSRGSPERNEELAAWWTSHGYTATAAPDGCWISIGRTRIQDIGHRMEVFGSVSDEVAIAIVLKAQECWDSGLYLEGTWSQADQDKIWIECQRRGVDVENCRPSQAARIAWQREQEASASKVKTISAARSAVAVAADVRAAAAGDLEALDRLPKPLQAFVASYLDDDDRKKLSAEGVAFIIPELDRFRRLGADELSEFERTGHTFTVPKPQQHHRRDDNKNDLGL